MMRSEKLDESLSLDSNELKDAENFLIVKTQKTYFRNELEYLTNDRKGKTPNLVRQLGLVLENGVIKCHGRLEFSNLPNEAKHPILMPPNAHVTKLLISTVHAENFHWNYHQTNPKMLPP